MSGSALSLSFHIRLNERCALTYPLRSALSLCEQLSLFSVPICSFLLSKSYLRLLFIWPFAEERKKKKNFRLLWPLLTSVRSALSHNNGYSFRSVPHRPPWGAKRPVDVCSAPTEAKRR